MNYVAHIIKPMNKVSKDWTLDITMLFLDDIHIKGFSEEENDEVMMGARVFVVSHIVDCDHVLQKLEDAHVTFCGETIVTEIGFMEIIRCIMPRE